MTTAKTTISISHSIKPKRRKYRETTISSSATHGASTITYPNHQTRELDNPIVVPTNKSSSCCSYSEHLQNPTRHPESEMPFSPGNQSPAMDFVPSSTVTNCQYSPHEPSSSFSKFNNVLTAGLLNPMSPPPDPTRIIPARSSPTLGEMMANEPEIQPRVTTQATNNANVVFRNSHLQNGNGNTQQLTQLSVFDKQALTLRRINEILENRSPGNQFNDSLSSDVKLTLSSKDGVSVSMDVHRQILVDYSRYFAVKLSDRWAKQQRVSIPYMIEIADCDDVEVYVETVRLMYSEDLRRKLMKHDVIRVLGILKVSAAIGFDDAVLSCLEYLEAAPWAEDEEEKVASLLSELNLEGVGVEEVLKRVSVEDANGTKENGKNEEVLINLLNAVLEGKDEKARREMKGLVSKLLRENSSHNDLRKESLYSACDKCLQLFRFHFLRAASGNLEDVVQIARQADNLHWILDILIDQQIAEDFLKRWASMSVLSEAHPKVPGVHRYEISRVTARLFVGLGKGQMLASKELRFLLLQTWLVPFYDDFGWMKRASKGLDRHLIEECLSNTISTLPLDWQQEILVAWFNRFLNSGDDCPNIQRAFEVWWRRAFWRRSGEPERTRALTITTSIIDNS